MRCIVSESVNCMKNEFRCGNGRCVPAHWQCDNEKDCSDGSDEDEHVCRKITGYGTQTCKTSFIILMFPDQKVCGTDEFTCRSTPGECVPLTWMCDDNPDCSDASDEKACSMYYVVDILHCRYHVSCNCYR